MKKIVAFCLLLVAVLPACAAEDGLVMYAGGTIPSLQAGVGGHLDTSSQTALSFEYAGNKLLIPYAKIDSFRYSQPVAHHLGFLPAVAIGLVKSRQRKHIFQVSFRDENNAAQVAIFEVPKSMPEALRAILQTRAPQACKPLRAAGQSQQY
jgi:hypothetical protein